MWQKAFVATALIGAGLGVTTGAAFAGEVDHDSSASSDRGHGDHGGHGTHGDRGHGDRDGRGGKDCGNEVKADNSGHTTQEGLVNVGDVQTITPLNACNNDIPLNALGVQVPIQDAAANLPVLSPNSDNGAGS